MTEDYDSLEDVVHAAEDGEFDTFEDYQETASEYTGDELSPREAALYERGTRMMLSQEVRAKHSHWSGFQSALDLTEDEVRATLRGFKQARQEAEETVERYEELYVTGMQHAAANDISVGESLENLNDRIREGVEQQRELREDVRETETGNTETFHNVRERLEEARDVVPSLDSRAGDDEDEEE